MVLLSAWHWAKGTRPKRKSDYIWFYIWCLTYYIWYCILVITWFCVKQCQAISKTGRRWNRSAISQSFSPVNSSSRYANVQTCSDLRSKKTDMHIFHRRYVAIYLSLSLWISMYLYLSISIFQFSSDLYLSICPSIHLSICLPIYLPVYLPTYQFANIPICSSIDSFLILLFW